MNSYTDLSFACLNLVDALYKNEDPSQAVQLLSELCRKDPIISAITNNLQRSPLPNFHDTQSLYDYINTTLPGTAIEDNPNWLMLNLFLADNGAQLISQFPNKMLISRGIINFALSLKDTITRAVV